MPGERLPRTVEEHIVESAHATDSVDVVSLDRAAAPLSVADQVTLRDADLREWVAQTIMPAFKLANGLTLAVVVALVVVDEVEILFRVITPAERIISSQVIMTLLGATTVRSAP